MIKLKTILQCDKYFILLLSLTILFSFIRITFFPLTSKITSNKQTGTIINYNYYDDKYKIVIKNKEDLICYYKTKEKLDISIGDKVFVEGNIYEPTNNTIPNTFNYKKYLNRSTV